ncbi:hypothetical protein GCM10009720_13400 [Yaniella flava]|uniref:PknH-like extracellular domain-containing protein n=1 Tax=Yaniella flava TaxID=287930 RepID=A0ABN2UDU3_9MICC|nr:hypothetical protein [Micrococcaceae bacterium]
MTKRASVVFRAAAIALAAGLGLAACSSDNADGPSNDNGENLEVPEAPAATAEETGLAETLESEFEVTSVQTLEDQWPDLNAMASALSGTAEPDLCQEAGAAQYGLFVNSKPPNVRASFTEEALLDDNASGETVHAFFANDEAPADRIQEVHENTDTACVEEYESNVAHEVTQQEVDGEQVDVHTWQVEASEQLTGRMVDVVGDEIYVRYAAAYPPQVLVEELNDASETEFNEQATERALTAYEAATAQ